MLVLTALTFAGSALADQRDFILVNKLGFTIQNIQVSEETNPSWEEDVLGSAEVLANEDMKSITFTGYKEGVCKFDIRITNMDDHAWTVKGIDLCTTAIVEFYMQNGVVMFR